MQTLGRLPRVRDKHDRIRRRRTDRAERGACRSGPACCRGKPHRNAGRERRGDRCRRRAACRGRARAPPHRRAGDEPAQEAQGQGLVLPRLPSTYVPPAVARHGADRSAAYTSCLRITTTPPSKDVVEDEQHETADITDHPLASPSPAVPSAPAPRGVLGSLGRPGFLRGFARQPAADLERGQPVASATA